MLLVLMYHGIGDLDKFRNSLNYLSSNYPIVVPGDALPPSGLSVCLTFDDAYFDFYHNVFPVLTNMQIKAVLGVPVGYIIEETNLDAETRLQVDYNETMKTEIFNRKVPFCTWKEIREMAESGFIKIASHSKSHANLIDVNANLSEEIVDSKRIIEDKLSQESEIFIYPYGKVNRKVHKFASAHYKYLMRIGSALNRDWHNSSNIIYRVNGEDLMNQKYISKLTLCKFYLKYLSNRIRWK